MNAAGISFNLRIWPESGGYLWELRSGKFSWTGFDHDRGKGLDDAFAALKKHVEDEERE